MFDTFEKVPSLVMVIVGGVWVGLFAFSKLFAEVSWPFQKKEKTITGSLEISDSESEFLNRFIKH